ncbi:MAG TPA: hypothetical protein VD862_02270 [Candidatus Paceibacterota bacterium]|nr:hypothetical protein [Candidatus Paceibacterota bacterium]
MKRTLIAALMLIAGALAYWSWSYREYDRTLRTVLTAQAGSDPAAYAAALESLAASRASWVLRQIPELQRRLDYAGGVLSLMTGDTESADRAFSVTAGAHTDAIAARALYNRGNLAVARRQLETAKDQYITALKADPGDLQTKINLELLLKRIEQEAKSSGKDKGDQEMEELGALTDLWSLKDSKDGASNQSQRIWR